MRPRPPLSLICGSFSSSVHLPSRFRCSRRNRTTAMPTTSLEIRAHAANEMGMGWMEGRRKPLLHTASEQARSRMHLRRRRETATDALKADFMTFRRRVHFVCRGGSDPRRQSLERGIRVGGGMLDEAPKTGARSSLIPSVPACFARPPILPSLPSSFPS